jgi:hypothetical protein
MSFGMDGRIEFANAKGSSSPSMSRTSSLMVSFGVMIVKRWIIRVLP